MPVFSLTTLLISWIDHRSELSLRAIRISRLFGRIALRLSPTMFFATKNDLSQKFDVARMNRASTYFLVLAAVIRRFLTTLQLMIVIFLQHWNHLFGVVAQLLLLFQDRSSHYLVFLESSLCYFELFM